MRAIPDQPFLEAGRPHWAAVSADGLWLATQASGTGPGGGPRVAVYRKSDFSLWDLVEVDHSVEAFSFHPVLPLLVLSTEWGEEWNRVGGLFLYEPQTRRRVSFPVTGAGVTGLRWLDAHRLEVTFSVPDLSYERDGQDAYARCVVERDAWLGVEDGAIDLGTRKTLVDEGEGEGLDLDLDWGPRLEPGYRVGDRLVALAAEAGRTWVFRDDVMAVEALRDGRVLCSLLSSSLLECWSAAGSLLWSVPVPEDTFHRSGCQMYVASDEDTAWVTVLVGTSDNRRTLLQRVDLADGTIVAEHRLDFPARLSARADGAWAARDSRDLFPPARWPPSETPVFTPTGRQLGTVALGECDRSFAFDVRRCPHLLFLQGADDGPRPEKWVVEASPRGVEPLFPLRWEECPAGPVGGGPGVYVRDGLGPGIVHAAATAEGPFLLRRALPHGEVVWAHRMEAEVRAVDAGGGLLYAVTAAKELLTLRPADGAVIRRRPTAVGAHDFTPRSLSVAPGGEVFIGTAEGRILVLDRREEEQQGRTRD
ncbi:hypothetical protein FGW37_02155 [Streptomyces rectiverticillatus]|uniref:hypothetical protein n=1 Tax=Streptomyces rectiverticillatus TaxID=173860 RepID=UPI0015C38382|nr:hypothetical protein [Streptomyces rectiverticillatus]QLE70566.1 hypothetical protein FGW37_02155 [Streptomyces rectiverticillatus]